MTHETSIAFWVEALRARVEWERELGADGHSPVQPGRMFDSPDSELAPQAGSHAADIQSNDITTPDFGHYPIETDSSKMVVAEETVFVEASSGSLEHSETRTEKSKAHALSELKFQLENCTQCPLHRQRNRIVFSDGTMNARLAFVGDFPRKAEDLISLPFVGPRGHLLNKIILAIGERRESCYLCNVVKCSPGEEKPPSVSDIQTCGVHLRTQLQLVSPAILVALGRTAAAFLLQTDEPIDAIRGRFVERDGMRIMPTFSLDYMIEHPESKREVWADMKQVKAELAQSTAGA